MIPLRALTPIAWQKSFAACTLAEARKLVSHVHRGGDLSSHVQGIRREVLAQVRAQGAFPELSLLSEEKSSVDPFVKYAFQTSDAYVIEAVRIPLEIPGRFSVCVSSQVGCALACAFCATGKLGLKRNLETWEILEQVRFIKARLPEGARIRGVVFQGMGEPLANLERVLSAIEVMRDPCAMQIDARAITVTTSGIPSQIKELADRAPNVRLGLSLGSVRQDVRKQLMPIAKAHTFEELMQSCMYHARKTNLSPMFAYTPLAGMNDTLEDARALGHVMRDFQEQTGHRPSLRLIPYNSIGENDPFRRQTGDEEELFRQQLFECGVYSKKRYSGGGDVAAACGQLAGKLSQPS